MYQGCSMKRRISPLLALMLVTSSAIAEEALDGRMNVMECSREEVIAYLKKPDPASSQMPDYSVWEKAYQQKQIIRSKTDPSICASALYGDLSAMGEKLKQNAMALGTLTLPTMNAVINAAMDKFMGSVCSRMKTVVDNSKEELLKAKDKITEDARKKANEYFGKKALERYATDAVIPPEYQSMGLKYRNGTLESKNFRKNVKERWKDKLDELKDDAKDSL